MTYIIGDIHANVRELESLLRQIRPESGTTLIFLGDYIDKQTNTEQTLQLLNELNKECHCIFIRGNHEFVWDKYVNGQDLERQSFLLQYGGMEALRQYPKKVQHALLNNNVELLKDRLQLYFNLIDKTKDWYITKDYLALHAGLLKEQYTKKILNFEERNFFLRPKDIPMNRKYLDLYRIVAGNTYLGNEPTIEKGYINIDLGAGYGKYMGALSIDENLVIRSDGKRFPL